MIEQKRVEKRIIISQFQDDQHRVSSMMDAMPVATDDGRDGDQEHFYKS
jgi:hypothetical protein